MDMYPDDTPIYMVTFFRLTANDYIREEGMSDPVPSFCEVCFLPVWSSKVKQLMKRIDPARVNLFCPICMETFLGNQPEMPPISHIPR